jgi:hypothetical protein
MARMIWTLLASLVLLGMGLGCDNTPQTFSTEMPKDKPQQSPKPPPLPKPPPPTKG